jgi:hypothetical protein
MRRQLSRSIAAVCALFLGAEARADLTYEVEAGVGHSDNITRVESEQVDETLATIGARVDYTNTTRRLDADVNVDLDYVEYLDDTYDGEVLGTADANLNFGLIPERLTWQVQDSFGQAQSDPFSPVTPDNSENVNYFTTGPDLVLNLGSQNSMRLFGRYSTTNYEVTDLDGERLGGGLSLIRALSGASSVALNGTVEESEFDNPASSGYENRSASVSYDFTGGRTTISSRLGYSWIELDDGTENGGELIELSVTREMSSSSSLAFSVGSQFSDAGNELRGFASGGGAGGGGPGQIVASSDPFENRTASLDWNFQRNRTGISVGIAYDENVYEEQTQYDRTRISYHGNFSRQLRPTLTFMLAARFSEDEFDLSGLKFDDTHASASLTWGMSRHLGLRASVEHFARGSSQPGGDFDENRAFLTVTYSGGRAQ